ncbi:MAG: glycosyltransferase family 39 protein [Victivallales bacterium]|nr:glycosyltransferase family 39 protein [Victivallales bacterium]
MRAFRNYIQNTVARYDNFIKRLAIWLDALPAVKLAALLVTAAVLLALLTSQFIEKSGDAVYKWGILKYYVETGQWYPQDFDHHQGRWALNLPVLALMKLFGSSAYVYYIYPMLCGIAGSLLIFKICTRIGTRLAGLAAFLIYFIFPLTARGHSQFLPMLPASTFILAAVYCMGQWFNRGKKFYIIAAALMLLFAYGCKITSLYWVLAFALFMALFAEEKAWGEFFRLRLTPSLLLFSGTVLAGLILETLLLNCFCGVSGGRLEIIALSVHLQRQGNLESCNFFVWLFSFLRPLSLRGKYFESFPCFFIFILGLASSLMYLKSDCIYKKFLAFITLAVYLLHCYMVYKIFPFLYPEEALSRYFIAVALLCIVLYCTSTREWQTMFQTRFPDFHYSRPLRFLLCLAWLVPALIYVGNSYLRNGTLLTVRRAAGVFSEAEAGFSPVLCALDKKPVNGILASTDQKNILRWLTLFGKTAQIPRLAGAKYPLITDGKGKLYAVLFNADKISASHSQDCVIINYNDINTARRQLKKPDRNAGLL